jgi:magnesium transporter
MAMIKDHVNSPGNIYTLYVVDDEHRLVGSTSLRRFINEDPQRPILEVCFPKNVFVRTDDGMEEVALLLEKYKFLSIPVVDAHEVLQGVITTDDVMEELIALAWSKYKEKLV